MHAPALIEQFLRKTEMLPGLPLPWTIRETFILLTAEQTLTDQEVALYAGAQCLGREVEKDRANAYHNTQHVGEVLWAVVILWKAEQKARQRRGLVPWPREAGLRLWVAMLGHDVGHPGTWVDQKDEVNRGAIEAASAQRVAQCLQKEGVSEAWVSEIVAIIEATEPFWAVEHARAQWRAAPTLERLLPVLAGEADILASAWPGTGPARGQRLAEEWRRDGHLDEATRVGSWTGRLMFLEHLNWCSAGATEVLRLPLWTQAERRVLTERAATLDGMPYAQACACHHAAVCACMALVPTDVPGQP